MSRIQLCRRLVGCLIVACMSIGVSPTVGALIQKLYSIKEVMDDSEAIAEGKIASVDAKAQTMLIRVTGDIKGKCAYKEMRVHVGFGDPWHPASMMKRVRADAPVLLFYKTSGTYAYNNRGDKNECYCMGYTGGARPKLLRRRSSGCRPASTRFPCCLPVG